eukprot:COSAG06_NODE_68471_length_223_cov_61.919355_1_plen_46_part_01
MALLRDSSTAESWQILCFVAQRPSASARELIALHPVRQVTCDGLEE